MALLDYARAHQKFFIPAPHKVTECDLDLRVGGRFNTVFEVDGQRMDNRGVFLEIDPGKKLILPTAIPKAETGREAVYDGNFAPGRRRGGQKPAIRRLRATPRKEIREQHEQMGFHEGWGIVLDQLVGYVKGLNA